MNPQILIDNGRSRLWAIENYSPDLFPYLKDLPLNEEPPIFMYDKMCRQRRNIGLFSDKVKETNYTVKQTTLKDVPVIESLLATINQSLRMNFNAVLVNQYINGEKHIGAHSDKEVKVDPSGKIMVPCLAYGTTRIFRIRDKITNEIVLDYYHKPCTLLVMEGAFQLDYKHEVPIQKRIKEERISVTFRHI